MVYFKLYISLVDPLIPNNRLFRIRKKTVFAKRRFSFASLGGAEIPKTLKRFTPIVHESRNKYHHNYYNEDLPPPHIRASMALKERKRKKIEEFESKRVMRKETYAKYRRRGRR